MQGIFAYTGTFGGRKMSVGFSGGYTYGFNGQYKDDEVYGEGNAYSFEYRIHDARLGRFLSVDPLFRDYPWNSTYAFAENKVIQFVELEGLEISAPKYLLNPEPVPVLEVPIEKEIPRPRIPQATISQGGVSGTPQYKQFQYNIDTYGTYTIPGFDIGKSLLNSEEITWADIGIEVAGIIPLGKFIGKVGKAVFKSEFTEGAFKEVATFLKNNSSEPTEVIKSRLEKSIKSHDKQILQHKEWISDPKKKLGDKWDNLSKEHQDNLLHHWKQDIKRHEAYKEVKEATLNEIK